MVRKTTLDQIKVGQTVLIITSPFRRLAEQGLYSYTKVKVIQNSDPMRVITSKGIHLGLSKDLAKQIKVKIE